MKIIRTTIFQIIILLIIVFGVAQISVAARPSTPPQSNPDILYSGSYGPKFKQGTLLLKNQQTPGSIASGFTLETAGVFSSTGLRLYQTSGAEGNISVDGKIYSDSLLPDQQSTDFLCANTDGRIIRCP